MNAPEPNGRRQVVLVGCGHAHLEVMRGARAFAARGADVVLVDPGLFVYSGRGSGLLSGRVSEADAAIDPEALARATGVRFLRERVVGLDRASRSLRLAGAGLVPFDLASFNIGSRGAGSATGPRLCPVKPIAGLAALGRRIRSADGPRR